MTTPIAGRPDNHRSTGTRPGGGGGQNGHTPLAQNHRSTGTRLGGGGGHRNSGLHLPFLSLEIALRATRQSVSLLNASDQGLRKMMKSSDRRIFQEFATKARQIAPDSRIIAFGSRARGNAAPDSDFDICVILQEANPCLEKQIEEAAWEVGFENDLVLMALCIGATEFGSGPISASSLARNIRNEGIAA
ncbi:MAG: nucleotidyltransferase domain-containing protein [Candidatus Sumerlaeota bacterium]|nr:nucleotidyltransferase domain-containing protein [Candidatus Sumerlaeota bacterium]